MKTFKQFLSEEGPVGDGDCFKVAGRAIIEDESLKLVHAFVYGQGPMKGRRFEHAWNEQGPLCIDNSNGQTTLMAKKQYYKLAGVVKKAPQGVAYASYDSTQGLVNMLKHKHWGPWDLNMSLEEEIPDEQREIGKKKLKISPKILQTIKDKIDG